MRVRSLSAASVTHAGTLTTGSPTVTGLVTSSLEGALRVRGTGIPRNTYVKSIDSASQVTLTKNATATGSQSLTFAIEPVMLQDAKDQLRLDADFARDDDSIARNIVTARETAEESFARAYLTSTFRLTLNGFQNDECLARNFLQGPALERSLAAPASVLLLPRADVVSVESLSYVNGSGTTIVLDPSTYEVQTGPWGFVVPTYGRTWPISRYHPGSLVVDFSAGYGPTADSVPDHVKEAVLMLVDHLYNNRSATVTSSIGLKEAPLAFYSLLALEDWGYRG